MRKATGVMEASKPADVRSALVSTMREGLRCFSPSLADAVFLFIFLRVLHLGSLQLFNDPGTGWHLRVGSEILHSRSLPVADAFSWTRAGERWIANQYLGEAALAAIYALGGYPLIALICALTLAALFRWIYRVNVEAGAWPIWAIIVTMLAAGAAAGQFLARPLLITLMGVPISLVVASSYLAGRCGAGRLAGLVALSLVWVQTHPGVLGGIITVFLVGAGGLIEAVRLRDPTLHRETVKRSAHVLATAMMMALSVLATPYGLAWPACIKGLMSLEVLPRLVDEWQPTDWTAPDGLAAALLVLLAMAGWVLRRERPGADLILVNGFWIYQAVQSARHVSILGLLVAVQAGALLRDVKVGQGFLRGRSEGVLLFSAGVRDRERQLHNAGVAPLVVVLAMVCFAFAPDGRLPGLGAAGPPPDKYSPALIEHLRRHPPPSPIFNDINLGGHLIHHAPHLPVYVDDRFELYGDEFIAAYERVMSQPDRYAETIIERAGIRSAIVGAATPLTQWLRRRPGWRRAYEDASVCVFVRERSER